MEFFQLLFDTSDFPPRWNCGKWSEGHGWVHIVSDVLISIAYVSIAFAIASFYWIKRSELRFPVIFVWFALFILSCGMTHLVDATLFWHPWYRLSAVLKVITAVASCGTVIVLLSLVPKALKYVGAAELERQLTERERQENELSSDK